jgi:hypothetical protein
MIFFSLNRFALSAALAVALVGVSPIGAQARASNQTSATAGREAAAPIAIPSSVAQLILIRDALTAFNHANLTGNYSVLQALGSQNFRTANPTVKLTKLFAPFRTNFINISPTLFLNPALARQPFIENGRLRLIGTFPSKPMAVNFDLLFEQSDLQWKLFGLSVSLVPASQAEAPRQ